MSKHEKIFQNEDGSRVKVVVQMFFYFNKKPTYRVSAYSCPKGKRTWLDIVDTDGVEYRKMNMTERAMFNIEQCIKVVGADRIAETANELWLSIKPELQTNFE